VLERNVRQSTSTQDMLSIPRQTTKLPLGTDVRAWTQQHIQTQPVSGLNVSPVHRQQRNHTQTTTTTTTTTAAAAGVDSFSQPTPYITCSIAITVGSGKKLVY